MATITTDTILNQFNIHELRLLSQKLGLDEKFGRRAAAKTATSDIAITLMPIKMLIEKIAQAIDIIIHKVSEGQAFTPNEKLDTSVVLNRFSVPLLQKLVKQIQAPIKVKGASKSVLVDALKSLVEFGYNFKEGHSIKKTYSAPVVEPSLESDALYMELKTLATNMRNEGNSKAEIVKSLKTMLKRTLSDVLDSNTLGVGESPTIYNLIKAEMRQLTTGYTPKDRAKNATISEEDLKINTIEKQLKQYIKSYMVHIDDIVDVMQEKKDALTGNTTELLVKRRMERAELKQSKNESDEESEKKPAVPSTSVAPKKRGRKPKVKPAVELPAGPSKIINITLKERLDTQMTVPSTSVAPKKRGRKPLFEKDTAVVLQPVKGRPKLDMLVSEMREAEKEAKRAEKLALRELKKEIADRSAQLNKVSKARKAAEKAEKDAAKDAAKAEKDAAKAAARAAKLAAART